MKDKQKIIVSLTSFPQAIPYAVQAIRSILTGAVLPDKIVLYIDNRNFPNGVLPQELTMLKDENPVFETRFAPSELRSYKKLIPALKDFPNDIIVTVDDDINYHADMLRDLLRLHQQIPDAILAHRARKVKLNARYRDWKLYKKINFIFKKLHFSHLTMPIGAGGVLYPPHALDKSMLNPALFMNLAPTCDDIWFWIAAVSRGTYAVPLPNGRWHVKELGKPKEISLTTINIRSGNDLNRITLDRILQHYPEIKLKLEREEAHSSTSFKSYCSK